MVGTEIYWTYAVGPGIYWTSYMVGTETYWTSCGGHRDILGIVGRPWNILDIICGGPWDILAIIHGGHWTILDITSWALGYTGHKWWAM